jgi:hypothetical protein
MNTFIDLYIIHIQNQTMYLGIIYTISLVKKMDIINYKLQNISFIKYFSCKFINGFCNSNFLLEINFPFIMNPFIIYIATKI